MEPSQNPPLQDESSGPGRIARIILSVAAILGSVAFLVVFFAIPIFNAMFADFGAPLAAATRVMIALRPMYAVTAVLSGLLAYYLLYRRKQDGITWVLMLALLGTEYFALVMSVAAMFMPIFQLGAGVAK